MPDALISFEDGKGYKRLRRRLAARGLTPEEYRTKWCLPADYPIVSPSYSTVRSQLAREIGLGSGGSRRAARAPRRAAGARL